MAFRLRGALFARLAVGAVVLVPLLGAGSAQAAVAGALPLNSQFRPDLSSATLVTASTVQFCFDKTLSQALVLNPSNFVLMGYSSFDNTSALAATRPVPPAGTAVYDLNNTSCVDVTYPSKVGGQTVDYNQYTIGSIGVGAVQSLSGAQLADADSTALTGSTTNNGTTGNTTAPDLTGVSIDRTHNIVNNIFNPQNRSNSNDPLYTPWIPTVIAGLTGFDLGLRFQCGDGCTAPNMAIEVTMDVQDLRGNRFVQQDSTEAKIGMPGKVLSPPAARF